MRLSPGLGVNRGFMTAEIKNVRGNISFTRMHPTNIVEIAIRDDLSGVAIINVEMSLDAFAEAILAKGNVGCTVKVFPTYDKIGLRLETKSVFIPTVSRSVPDASSYEVEGWVADPENGFNWHRYDTTTKSYRRTFHRWVASDPEPSVQKHGPSAPPRVILCNNCSGAKGRYYWHLSPECAGTPIYPPEELTPPSDGKEVGA